MDAKTTKTVVIVVAVVVVIAAAAAIIMMRGNNSGGGGEDIDLGDYNFDYMSQYDTNFDYFKQTRLAVLGNANNDTTIDSDDVGFIKNLIKNGEIDARANSDAYAKNYMADATNDGKINENDVKYVQEIIDGKSTKLFYESLTDGIASYTPAKKTYIITSQRCYARAAVMIANSSTNVEIVGGSNDVCTEVEFQDVVDQDKIENIGTYAYEDAEKVSAIVAKYKGNGATVAVLTGSTGSYCKDFENKGTQAQFIRFISWEGDALSGLLTAAFLIDGAGNEDAKDGTAWGKAKEFEAWYDGYMDVVKKQSAKMTSKTTAVLGYVADGLGGVTFPKGCQTSNTMRGTGTSENVMIENGGGKNMVNLFPSYSQETAYGRVPYTLEDIAAVFQKADVSTIIIMNGVMCGIDQDFEDEFGACLAKAFKGFVPSTTNIYVKSWLLNGVPMAIDQIVIAKMLMPDDPVVGAFDIEKIWNEYLELYGAPENSTLSYDNCAFYGEKAYHTS